MKESELKISFMRGCGGIIYFIMRECNLSLIKDMLLIRSNAANCAPAYRRLISRRIVNQEHSLRVRYTNAARAPLLGECHQVRTTTNFALPDTDCTF